MFHTSLHPSTPPRWMQSSLDAAADGIMIETAERVVYANAAYTELLGYRRVSDLASRSIAELVSDVDADRVIRFGRMRIQGRHVPSSYDFVALRSDASAIRLQASVSLSVAAGSPYITTIARPFAPSNETSTAGPIAGPHETLSPREREIMEMLLAGMRPKSIALQLGLTGNTVATFRVRLLEKIGVADNRELFQYALRHKLVDWS